MKLSTLLAWPVICFVIMASHPLPAQTADDANKAKLEQRDQLSKQALQAAREGKFDEAASLFEQVYTLEESIFGPSHIELIGTLGILIQVAEAKNDFQEIIDYRKRQQQVTEQLYGKDDYRSQDADRAVSDAKQREAFTPEQKSNLAEAEKYRSQMMQAYQQGQYSEGVSPAAECLAIHKELFGTKHPSYADSLNSLAEMYRLSNDIVRAEPLLRQAKEATKETLGETHPSYVHILANLAGLYVALEEYNQAAKLYSDAIEIGKRVFDSPHPTVKYINESLAAFYQSTEDHRLVEPLFREAIQMSERAFGKTHPDFATVLDDIGGFYLSHGDYEVAEPILRQAMEIREKTFGKVHLDYAKSLTNLSAVYLYTGDYAAAAPLLHQVLQISEQLFGQSHYEYSTAMNNLGELYRFMGQYAKAEPLLKESLAILVKSHGKENFRYIKGATNLASLYCLMDEYSQAEMLCLDAVKIGENLFGSEHTLVAYSRHCLADIYERMGKNAAAETLYGEVMITKKKLLGDQHGSYASILVSFASFYDSIGDYIRAFPLYREAVEISLSSLERTSDIQSERQQVRMGEWLRPQLDGYLSLTTREPKFQEQAYAALLRWKGSVWQRQLRQQSLRDQPTLQPRIVALQEASSMLSKMILNPPSDAKLRDDWKEGLETLTVQREKLQRDLSLASVEFRQSQQTVTPDELRRSLPTGTMLIDFLEYNHLTPAKKEKKTRESWERRLLVHLVRSGEEVRAIDLGPVESLNSLVQTWRKDLGQSRAAADAAQELRQRIWMPIESQLSGITTVYVSPDGLLGQFPLAALPGNRLGSYLLEELAIIQLPVPQGLPAMATQTDLASDAANDRFCLVGGVDYEKVSTGETPSSPGTDSVPSGPLLLAARGGQWQAFAALPGTAAEIDTIESLVRQYRPTAQTTILRGDVASESAFAKTAANHRFLHIATHGFFAPESVQNAMTASTPDTNRMMGLENDLAPRIVGQHPDLLSGLVFAGANQEPTAGAEDGILTAAEVQKLDLRGVELAILSACETGLGRTAGGEGIIGLQRAFQLAGAKTTITSLWQVDDAATQALMVEFYRNLFERKLSKLESLRQAQIWLLNNPDVIEGRNLTRGPERKTKVTDETKTTADKPTRSLPAYWAAFQLSGDPR